MSRLVLGHVLATLVACSSTDGPRTGPTDLESVLDRHASAMGGRRALDSLRNLDIRFEVREPTFTVEGRYRASRDGRVRVDIYADGRNVFSEGIDTVGAWQQAGRGAPVEPVSEEGAAALRHGVELNIVPLHRMPDRGHRLILKGRETIQGVNYHVLGATLRDGFTTYLYVDPESWLVARRRDVRALHPDIDAEERPLETVHLSWGTVCGIRRATRSLGIDLATGDTIQRTRTLDQICNRSEEELELGRPSSGPPRR